MSLHRAANYFARTDLYGWNGTTFEPTGAKGTLDPYDRFVSEREFGLKRRMLLVDPKKPIPDKYTVIRVGETGPQYLRGWLNEDIFDDQAYSLIYLLHRATEVGQLVSLGKVPKASGMAFTTVDVPEGNWHCNAERVTYSNSQEFSQLRISDSTITLPADCPAQADHEFILGPKRYVIQEVYTTAGFVQARAQVKSV